MRRLEDRPVDAHDLALVLDGFEIVTQRLWHLAPAKDAYLLPLCEVVSLIEQVRSKYDIPILEGASK